VKEVASVTSTVKTAQAPVSGLDGLLLKSQIQKCLKSWGLVVRLEKLRFVSSIKKLE